MFTLLGIDRSLATLSIKRIFSCMVQNSRIVFIIRIIKRSSQLGRNLNKLFRCICAVAILRYTFWVFFETHCLRLKLKDKMPIYLFFNVRPAKEVVCTTQKIVSSMLEIVSPPYVISISYVGDKYHSNRHQDDSKIQICYKYYKFLWLQHSSRNFSYPLYTYAKRICLIQKEVPYIFSQKRR